MAEGTAWAGALGLPVLLAQHGFSCVLVVLFFLGFQGFSWAGEGGTLGFPTSQARMQLLLLQKEENGQKTDQTTKIQKRLFTENHR